MRKAEIFGEMIFPFGLMAVGLMIFDLFTVPILINISLNITMMLGYVVGRIVDLIE